MNHYDSDTEPNSENDEPPEKGTSSDAQIQLFDFKSNDKFNLPRRQKRNETTSCSADKP